MMETENIPEINQHRPKPVGVTIMCALCDIAFSPGETKTTICSNCIINQTDITVGITKEGIINHCRFCHRYLRPPWVLCDRESKELLALCLKRLRGLNKVKIVDAAFVYTDPSTKRIKVRLTIQKEVMNNTNLQQSFICEFAEHYQQCDDCKKEFTPHTWGASVQIRQKVSHKKTFYFLEQMLLKHNAADKVLKIEQVDDGLDFFYKNRSHAMRLIDYLETALPIRVKASKQLISHDCSSNTFFYKYVYAVDLPKICKDDLVIIPSKLAKELGGLGRVQICYKMSTIIHLIDPLSMKVSELSIECYTLYENDFKIFSLKDHQSEFTVVDSEKIKTQSLNESYMSSSQNAFIERVSRVTIIKDGGDYIPITVKSHLGDILKPGSIAVGYDLTQLVIEEVDEISKYPDVILVRRQVDKEQRRLRIFKLKRLEMQNKMDEEGAPKKRQNKSHVNQEDQFEEFLDDVSKDKALRKNINLYRDENNIKKMDADQLQKQQRQVKKQQEPQGRKYIQVDKTKPLQQTDEAEEQWEDDGDEIQLEELMRDLNIVDQPELALPVEDANYEINQFIDQLDKVKLEK